MPPITRSKSSLLDLFDKLHVDDFAPDDENEALVYPDEKCGELEADNVPLGTGAEKFDLSTDTVPSTSVERPKARRHRASPIYKTPSHRTRKLVTAPSGVEPILGRKKKSAARAAAFQDKKRAETHVHTASTSMDERAARARGYNGPLHGSGAPDGGLIEIELGDGAAVTIYDGNGLKTVHRASQCRNGSINEACIAAAESVKSWKPTFGSDQDRGSFNTYYFSMHRGSVLTPRMSTDVMENPELYDQLTTILEPVRKWAADIFKAEFPLLYARYAETAEKIAENVPGVSAAFFPWASFCINISAQGVVTLRHIDTQNLAPGICVVIPFGFFNPKLDAKLHIEELGYTFQLAPGTPIYFPSALYTHYNSKLITMGMRGSIVGWTGASVFQYADLGCRAVNQLSASEKKVYLRDLKATVASGFELFPCREEDSEED
ncbi:hypothetical protein C8J57DRAFT_1229706 [Mycena rebaudengoi]|nr:hypothetical protein C8J57DRAFT_1229706 [Mycena rebaudengoi]